MTTSSGENLLELLVLKSSDRKQNNQIFAVVKYIGHVSSLILMSKSLQVNYLNILNLQFYTLL